jgi:hypothetical protein
VVCAADIDHQGALAAKEQPNVESHSLCHRAESVTEPAISRRWEEKRMNCTWGQGAPGGQIEMVSCLHKRRTT